jgi:hypothetical protein
VVDSNHLMDSQFWAVADMGQVVEYFATTGLKIRLD